MKTLILSCNTGEGHNSTGGAIKEYFDRENIECNLIDALNFASPVLSSLVSRGHVFVYRKMPKLFELGYKFEENHSTQFIYDEFSKCADKLHSYVSSGGYDTVICVHVFASFMLRAAKEEYGLEVKSYFVATDYTCSPGVNNLHLDTYFIPHPLLAEEFVEKGVERDKLFPSGIPIHDKFFSHLDKYEVRETLGIGAEKKVILLSCGSMGCGPIKKITSKLSKQLHSDEELVVICGTNRKLYKKLSRYSKRPNIRILGFCTQMCEYMSACDLFLTKPGGLSTTEAIACRLPLLCINAVGGCETRNLEFMLSIGVTDTRENTVDFISLALEYLRDENKREAMRERMEVFFNFNSTELLCSHIINNV